MNIKLIVVGKIKESYLEEAIQEYKKRLLPFSAVEMIEIKERNTPDATKNLSEEGLDILEECKSDDFIIACAIEGKYFSSEEFAQWVDSHTTYSSQRLVFIIGSSCGLSPAVKQRASLLLSFGPMTYPHQLMRVILLEQIYRLFTILYHKKYHK
ncbi:MAG: 23S rRNA (pseudouridine(1915)-N(3))-methyltransferase RlmH [Bacilli bacterium]|nr:23S rRNA (pseudouridine(1915)-N(3))-methyltransferase RlmH [Bacilli bacterium]